MAEKVIAAIQMRMNVVAHLIIRGERTRQRHGKTKHHDDNDKREEEEETKTLTAD